MMALPVPDFSSDAFLADPYPTYHALLQERPVVWWPFAAGGGMWLVSRYDDVLAALKEKRLAKDFGRFLPEEELSPFNRSMLFRDPPDHTRLRGLVSLAFTPKMVARLRGRMVALVDEMLAQMRAAGEADFIAGLALPLPVTVIADMLGVPAADQEKFRRWSYTFTQGSDAAHTDQDAFVASMAAEEALADYLRALIARRRQAPQADLISDLIAARDGEEALSEEELVGTCMLLLIAGHETTVNLLGNGMLTLMRHPEQFARLRADRSLLPSAIEEMLRYESPVQRGTGRFAVGPLEIAGQVIQPGQQVSVALGAANRDPAHFADPDRFDITRTPNRHLGFGFGIHFCLGAPLARLEADVAFGRLLALDVVPEPVHEQPEWRVNTFFRGLSRLPVRWVVAWA